MGMDIKIDSSLPVIIYVISFHVQDLSPLIILSNIMASFLFSSNETQKTTFRSTLGSNAKRISIPRSILFWIGLLTPVINHYPSVKHFSSYNRHEQRNLLIGIIISVYYNPVPCMLPCSQHTDPLARTTVETSQYSTVPIHNVGSQSPLVYHDNHARFVFSK